MELKFFLFLVTKSENSELQSSTIEPDYFSVISFTNNIHTIDVQSIWTFWHQFVWMDLYVNNHSTGDIVVQKKTNKFQFSFICVGSITM